MITFPEPSISELLTLKGSVLRMPRAIWTLATPMGGRSSGHGAVDDSAPEATFEPAVSHLSCTSHHRPRVSGSRTYDHNVYADVYRNVLVETGIHRTGKMNVVRP